MGFCETLVWWCIFCAWSNIYARWDFVRYLCGGTFFVLGITFFSVFYLSISDGWMWLEPEAPVFIYFLIFYFYFDVLCLYSWWWWYMYICIRSLHAIVACSARSYCPLWNFPRTKFLSLFLKEASVDSHAAQPASPFLAVVEFLQTIQSTNVVPKYWYVYQLLAGFEELNVFSVLSCLVL